MISIASDRLLARGVRRSTDIPTLAHTDAAPFDRGCRRLQERMHLAEQLGDAEAHSDQERQESE